ncbi:COG1733 Predicted transcriptional regulators [Caulobacteraceae bacterium]|jgi:DNA-binding HxlR family transcriptional regulator|eukprot:gene6927-biopygen3065
MRWSELDQADCPIARALSILGDRWTFLILRDCFFGVHRFEGFQANLGISRTILRDRLAHLVQAGILVQRPYQERPIRYDYVLSAKGKALNGVMLMLGEWGRNAVDNQPETQIRHRHQTCGHVLTPYVACATCGEEVVAKDVRAVRAG